MKFTPLHNKGEVYGKGRKGNFHAAWTLRRIFSLFPSSPETQHSTSQPRGSISRQSLHTLHFLATTLVYSSLEERYHGLFPLQIHRSHRTTCQDSSTWPEAGTGRFGKGFRGRNGSVEEWGVCSGKYSTTESYEGLESRYGCKYMLRKVGIVGSCADWVGGVVI